MVKNILFSDANHGGLVLLEEYFKYTQNNLFFYDIYDKLSVEDKEYYTRRFGVKFLVLDEILADEDSFVKINPIHMPPVINTDYTHHEFVWYLLGKMNADFKFIQVTGVKGKTTVTSLIGDILCDYNTLVLTSDALMYNGKVLMEKLSITPASIITAVNNVKEQDLFDEIDYCVFEVSLGVVPNAFINVLTNILEDYPICRGASSASVAKESVFTSKYTLCDFSAYKMFYSGYDDVISVSLDDDDADIFASNVHYDIKNTAFEVNYFDKKYDFNHFALSDFYINNLLFAISVGLLLDIHVENIISNLKKSESITGRNSYKIIDDKMIIEDINPGLNTTSIKKCIDNLSKFSKDYHVILGGDYGITCEEIDEEKLSKYIRIIDEKQIILCGELGLNLRNKLTKDYVYFKKISEAVSFCLKNTDKKLIQIIYRSEYNSNINELLKIIDNR